MAFQTTVDITNAQEAALQRLIDYRYKDEPTKPTPQEFLEGSISDLVIGLRNEYLSMRRDQILAALANASGADLDSIESTLGLA